MNEINKILIILRNKISISLINIYKFILTQHQKEKWSSFQCLKYFKIVVLKLKISKTLYFWLEIIR